MRRKSSTPLLLFGFLATALLCFGWILFSGEQIGNDYQSHQVAQAMNFRYFQKIGVEPQWFAYLTGGIPIHGLALTQAFYFPGWLIAQMPGYWTGRALDWFSFRFLLLAICGHFAFYAVIRKFFLAPRTLAFIFSLAFFYQLRTLDSLRFGNAMDATVLAYGIVIATALFFKKPNFKYGLFIFLLTYLLFTASYIAIIPHIILGSLFILFALHASSNSLFKTARLTSLALVFTILGFIAAAPNWLPFFEWLQVNAHRVKEPSLEWASFVPMAGHSLRANLWFPWAAEVHSGFAGSTLLILMLGTLASLALLYIRHTWIFLFGLALPFLYAIGSKSPIFLFFFHYVPGFSSIRVPGRIFTILPLVVFALALALFHLHKSDPAKFRIRLGISGLFSSFVVFAGAIFTLFNVVDFGPATNFGNSLQELTPERLNEFWDPYTKILWLLLALGAAALFALLFTAKVKLQLIILGLGVTTVVQVAFLMNFGTWRTQRIKTPTFWEYEEANKLPMQGQAPIIATNELYESTYGTATVPYTRFFKKIGAGAACFLPMEIGNTQIPIKLPFYFPERVICVDSADSALAAMANEKCKIGSRPTAFVVDSLNCHEASKNAADVISQNSANRIISLTPNRFVLSTDTHSDSYFVSPFPLVTNNWNVKINGNVITPILINGAFLGAFVPKGKNILEISYFSPLVLLALRMAALAFLAAGMIFVFGYFAFRVACWATILLLLVFAPGYFYFEKSYADSVRKEMVLKNDYSERLERQIESWRK